MIRVGMLQAAATEDKQENLSQLERAMRQTHEEGVQLFVAPETFMAYCPASESNRTRYDVSEPLDGPFVSQVREFARQYRQWTVVGLYERPGAETHGHRVYNTVVLIDAAGALVSRYRKTHLYDAFGYRESDQFIAGADLFQPVAMPGGRIGLLVCYELRFPEVAREQIRRGADFLVVPSAWYAGPYKEMHWELLVRARALENTSFVFAGNQSAPRFTGRSLAVNPMGVVIAGAGATSQLVVANYVPEEVVDARSTLPSLMQRRPELYEGRGQRDVNSRK